MTIYTPKLAGQSAPKYLAIADAITADISGGTLAAGDKLPPQRELAYELGVTVGTVSRAYAEIAQRGLVTGEVGRGTYVRDMNAEPVWTAAARDRHNGFITLTQNAPWFGPHATGLAQTLTDIVANAPLEPLLDYMDPVGPQAHRAAGAAWIGRVGLDVEPSQIIVCGGAQHGLSLCLSAFSGSGDTVLMEELTYLQLLDAALFQHRGAKGVALDDDGMRPEALDAASRDSGARVVFLVPTLHNPTNSVMSEQRRREIVEVARRRDLLIVEDDVYGYLIEDRPPPIATLAPERTIYITSASKCLAAGLRVAWIAAPHDRVARLADALRVNTVAQPALTGEVVRRWIDNGMAERFVHSQAEETAARNALADEYLAGFRYRSHPASFHLLLSLPDPWTADGYVAAARDRGVAVLPARLFSVAGHSHGEAVRLSLSQPRRRDDLRRGLEILRGLLNEAPPRTRTII